MDKDTPISKFLSARENQSWRVSPESRAIKYDDSFLQNDSFFELSPSSSFSPRKRKRFSTGESEVEMERDMRLMKSELIESKTKVSKLESLLEEAKNKYVERLIGYEKEDTQLKSENRFLNEKIRVLEDQKKKYDERDGERGESLSKKKDDAVKKATNMESKLRKLQIENFELLYKYQAECMEWKDKERRLNEKVEETKHGAEKWIIDTQMQEEQLNALKTQLDETKKLLEVAEEKANNYSDQQQATNEGNAAKESSIKNLENRFVSQQIEIKKLHSQISSLAEANNALKTSINREHVLETEVSSLLRKVEWLNAEMKKMRFYEMERDEVKDVLKSWEEVAKGVDPSNTTPAHFQAFLRKTQNLLIELKHENTNLHSSLQRKDKSIKTMVNEADFNKTQIKELIQGKEKTSLNLKKLTKRLLLITKDRDGLQSLKESYEAEYTGLITEPLQKRIAQLEETIKEYEVLISEEEANKECSDCKEHQSKISSLVIELKDLKQLNERLNEELKCERSTTENTDETLRVISFGKNPSLKSLEDRVKDLVAENEKMKEELQGKPTISTLDSAFTNKDQTAQQELDALQLKNEELNAEIIQEKTFLFNIMCKLFGFRININREPNTVIHLNSIYYPPEEGEFVFQAADNGDMILLQTTILDNFQTEIQEFLVEQGSIPAFLSAVTITCAREQPGGGQVENPVSEEDPNDSRVTVDNDDDESVDEEEEEGDDEEVEEEEEEEEGEPDDGEDSDGSDIVMLDD